MRVMPVCGRLLLVAVVVVVVMTVAVRGEERSVFNQPDWGFWCYPGDDYTLHCNHSSLPLKPSNYIRWELPSGALLEKSEEKYELGSDAQAQVTNMHLTIRNVQGADAGVYLCHVYTTSSLEDKRGHLLRGLNMGVHLYRDPFDQYRQGVLVGGCAAAAMFVLLTAGCLIYKLRYRVPKQLPDSRFDHRQNGTNFQHHLEVGEGTELPTVVSHKGKGKVNRSFDMESERATRM